MKLNKLSFFVLDGLSHNSVEGSPALVGNDPRVDLQPVSLLVLFNVFLLLELLQAPPDDLGAGVVVRLGGAVAALESSVDVGEESDSGVRPEVDLAGEGGDPSVDPIVVERGELVSCMKR